MLRMVRECGDTVLLSDSDGRHVGWVRDRTVHFTGFGSLLDAVAAVIGGGNALAAYLRGTTDFPDESGVPPTDARHAAFGVDDAMRRPARLAHDGMHEWVVLGGRRVARLITPADARRGGDATHDAPADLAQTPCDDGEGELAIEFVLPDGVSTDASMTLAQVLYSAVELHRSGGPSHDALRKGQPSATGAAFPRPSRAADVALPPVT